MNIRKLSQRFKDPSLEPFWLLSPTLFVLVFFFILPSFLFFIYSFLESKYYRVEWVFTLQNYITAFSRSVYIQSALNSISIGLTAGVIAILVSYPLAYFLTFRLKKGRNIVLFFVVISLFSSYLVRVYAWKTILGKEGLINSLLIYLGIIQKPLLVLLFSRLAVIIALLHVFLPFTILPILSSLQNIPRELIEAAGDLGCSPFRGFLRVTLPLSMRGVFSAFTYTFLLSAADYITPQLVGGTSGGMIGISIANQFVKVGDFGLGAAIAFAYLFVLVMILWLFQIFLSRIGLLPKQSKVITQ